MNDPKDNKAPKVTGRYRKVEVRTWGDEKFRNLSPMPPCGQGLWLFLITGPHTGPIPGLFRAGRAAMAEELDWEIEAFDKAFQEAFQQGMVKADFKARVMWVPNAIKHNRPESPNVVKSWAAEFDLIPECDLKREAYEALKASIHALGEAFGKAFDETFGKPLAKPSPKAMPNQEQEQEQEQEKGSAEPQGDSPPAGDLGSAELLAGVEPDGPIEPPVVTIPLVDGSEFPVTEPMVAEWELAYPAVDVRQQLREMRAWCNANRAQRKTARGVSAFIVRWLGKEQDRGGQVGGRGAVRSTEVGSFV